MLKVKNLTKYFKKENKRIKALSNVSFEIEKPCVCCIVGLNGAGKTTLLNCIVGLLIPDEGDVLINNIPSYKKLQCAFPYLPYPATDPRATVKDIIEIFRIFWGNFEDEEYYIKLFELDEELNTEYQRLSAGFKVRLKILSTLYQNQPIIVFDEITNGLDLETSKNVLNIMKELSKEKIILFASHIFDHINYVNDLCIFLHEGKLKLIKENVENSEDILKRIISNEINNCC
jgi:ABC-2 type transport system ATP-binding protein